MLRALGNAFALLTVIPARYSEQVAPDRMSAWFPLVGLLLGSVVLGVGWALPDSMYSHPASLLLAAAIIVAALASITRGMHWDALADVSDGWWGGHTPERRREIASDSHTGAFGVAGVVFVALIQTTALAELLASPMLAAIPLVFSLSRFAATVAAWWGRPAKTTGLGSAVSAHPDVASVIVALISVAAVIALTVALDAFATAHWVTVALLAVIAAALPFVISRRFGGTTGDVMGASIILVETIGLTTFAFLGVIG